MKRTARIWIAAAGMIFLGFQWGCSSGITFTKPTANSTVSAPVEICMRVQGYTVEPASKGVRHGSGHHHLLVDVPVPKDLSKPIAKDQNHIHMGDGSHCKTLNLEPGFHTIQTLFATGDHVPYNPPLTNAISFVVK